MTYLYDFTTEDVNADAEDGFVDLCELCDKSIYRNEEYEDYKGGLAHTDCREYLEWVQKQASKRNNN